MDKNKLIAYSSAMVITLILEVFLVAFGIYENSWVLYMCAGIIWAFQALAGAYMWVEAAWKFNSESARTTMAFTMLIPLGQTVSLYFLYRVYIGH